MLPTSISNGMFVKSEIASKEINLVSYVYFVSFSINCKLLAIWLLPSGMGYKLFYAKILPENAVGFSSMRHARRAIRLMNFGKHHILIIDIP